MAAAAELTAIIKAEDRASPVLKGLQGRLLAIGGGMKKAGLAATAAGGAIVGALGMAAKAAADFEAGMREVNSMMGLGEAEFQAFSKDVLKLAEDLGVNAVDSTKALYQAISAGVPKENAVDFLRIATKAAIAGVTDTETAVDGLTTVLNAFKLPLEDTQKVADLMFQTVKGGKTTFDELAARLFNVAPIAAASGIAFEEVSAALATMTKQGVPTSVATTQLRQAMVALQKPTKEMAAAIMELGYDSGQAMLQELGFAKTLNLLRDSTKGSNEMLMRMFGSVEAGAAVLALTGENAQMFTQDLEAMKTATEGVGAATEAFNQINKSASRQFEQAKAKLQAMAISIGAQVLPQLLPLVEMLKDIINKVSEWMKRNPQLTGTIIKVAGAIGALLVVAGPILMVLGALLPMLPMLGAAFAALAGPVGLVILAITALIAAGVAIYKNWDKIRTKAIEIWNSIVATIRNAVNNIIDFINRLINKLNMIPGVNIGYVNRLGGPAATPHIAGFQGGGVVPGHPGEAVPILAHAGERVLTAGQARGAGAGSLVVNVYPQGHIMTDRDVAAVIREELVKIKQSNYTSGL